jgi:hypothetical protein
MVLATERQSYRFLLVPLSNAAPRRPQVTRTFHEHQQEPRPPQSQSCPRALAWPAARRRLALCGKWWLWLSLQDQRGGARLAGGDSTLSRALLRSRLRPCAVRKRQACTGRWMPLVANRRRALRAEPWQLWAVPPVRPSSGAQRRALAEMEVPAAGKPLPYQGGRRWGLQCGARGLSFKNLELHVANSGKGM